MSRACRFRGSCPAVPPVDRDYCPVHEPEKLLQRVEAIIENNFGPFMAAHPLTVDERKDLWKLRDDLLYDLRHTV